MKKRWESYVMYRQNEKLVEFWKEYYKDKSGAKSFSCWVRALTLE